MLYILVTSRKEQDIERRLEDLVEEDYIIGIQNNIVSEDIQLYVRERLRNDKDLQKQSKDRELYDKIKKVLLKGV